MSEIYWIGARESDILGEKLIKGSITRYGRNVNNNISFCQNDYTNSYDEFLSQTLSDIIYNHPYSSFLFANETFAYKFGKEVFYRSICLNKISIIEALNDKIFFRQFINKDVDVPPSIIVNMYKEINYDFIRNIFDKEYGSFVLQTTNSAGGDGSILLNNNSNSENLSKLTSPVLITPFITHAIPINIHIAISRDDIRIFPPSVQLIYNQVNYCGADFIKYQGLSKKAHSKIINQCYSLAKKIQNFGAIGIFGVDLLLQEKNIYFIECNFRYQGSTFVLNQGLINSGLPSVFNIRYKCFYDTIHDIPVDVYNIKINYSSFRRTVLTKDVKLPKPITIKADGNNISSPLRNGYIQYEVFNRSIFDYLK